MSRRDFGSSQSLGGVLNFLVFNADSVGALGKAIPGAWLESSARPSYRSSPEVPRDGAGLDADGRGVAGDHLRVAPAARLLDGGGGGAAADQL